VPEWLLAPWLQQRLGYKKVDRLFSARPCAQCAESRERVAAPGRSSERPEYPEALKEGSEIGEGIEGKELKVIDPLLDVWTNRLVRLVAWLDSGEEAATWEVNREGSRRKAFWIDAPVLLP